MKGWGERGRRYIHIASRRGPLSPLFSPVSDEQLARDYLGLLLRRDPVTKGRKVGVTMEREVGGDGVSDMTSSL